MTEANETCLVFDTTNHWISIGLFGENLKLEKTSRRGREASDLLISMIRDILREGGLTRPDWIVCAIGPGSFTGARICVGTARNLAQAWDIPVLGIDSLAFYAYECVSSLEEKVGPLAVLIDGKQSKTYIKVVNAAEDPTGFTKAPILDLNPADFFAGMEPGTRCFTDEKEAVERYIKQKLEKENSNGIETIPTPPVQEMTDVRAAVLYELGKRMGGINAAKSWLELVPEYVRTDPATAKYPLGL